MSEHPVGVSQAEDAGGDDDAKGLLSSEASVQGLFHGLPNLNGSDSVGRSCCLSGSEPARKNVWRIPQEPLTSTGGREEREHSQR